MAHSVHTSERKSFKGCRRRWHWIFREGYYPTMTPKPFEFGTAYHAAMEVYYNPETWDWDREVVANMAILKFLEKNEAQKKRFLSFKDQSYLEDEVEADYAARVELGKGMLKYYFENVAPKTDVNFKPVKVEIAFEVPIVNAYGEQLMCYCDDCGPAGEGVTYGGRIDMLAQDQAGAYWIFDWKTAASIPQDHSFLYLDDQVGSYVWALKMLGLNVRGFIYVEHKKGFPQAPKMNTNRRLGRLFSVAKNADTSYDMYLETVQEQDAEAYAAGLYDEHLEWLRIEGPVYTHREQIHKTDKEIENIGRYIYEEAAEMIDPNIRLYPNSGRFSCTTCAFKEPCKGMNNDEDFQYTLDTLFEKRTKAYYEEGHFESSTEKRGGE